MKQETKQIYRVKYWIYVNEHYGEWRRTGLMTFDNALKVAESLAVSHHQVELYADDEETENERD